MDILEETGLLGGKPVDTPRDHNVASTKLGGAAI